MQKRSGLGRSLAPPLRARSDFGFRLSFGLRVSAFGLNSSRMDENLQITINGCRLSVPPGTLVAAAIAQAGMTRFRRSVSGQSRGPLCGMGTCMECRVTINGQAHCRSCQTLCAPDMDIKTDE